MQNVEGRTKNEADEIKKLVAKQNLSAIGGSADGGKDSAFSILHSALGKPVVQDLNEEL